MILWYSGTGNSRFAAEVIAAETGEQPVSMNALIKKGGRQELSSAGAYVFVFPAHAWQPPICVLEFIRHTVFRGSARAYFVMTAAGEVGDSEESLREVCEAKAFKFMGLGAVVMPENYAARFAIAPPDENRAIVRAAVPKLREIGRAIAASAQLDTDPALLGGQFKTHHLHGFFVGHMNGDRPFRVTGCCNGCGRCAEECALNNIVMQDGRPVWQGHCEHCMGCYGNCPAEAIEYGRKTANRAKYSFDKLEFRL